MRGLDAFVFLGELHGQRIHIRQRHVAGHQLGEQRAGDGRGGNAHDQRVQDGLADVRLVGGHGQQRGRVRRDQPVHHRQAGHHRDAHQHHGGAGTLGHVEGDRHQQHEAHFEEHGQANDKGDGHHGPVHVLLAEGVDQRARNALGAAGLRHHLAEHGAQAHHQRDVAEGAAYAGLERFDDVAHRHAHGKAEQDRDDHQGDKGIELEFRDQHDQCDHRDQRVQQ